MLSFPFTDEVFVRISTGFKCSCAKKHSGSDSLLLPILYSFGKKTILILSRVHFVQKNIFFGTNPAVITKWLNFVWLPKSVNRFCRFFSPLSILIGAERPLLLRPLTANSVLHHQNASNEAVLWWWKLW